MSNGKFYALLAIVFVIALLCIVNLVALFIASHSPAAASGRDGKDAVVDYDKIEAKIQERIHLAIAALPAPKDGLNGRDGRDGQDGADGKDGRDGRDAQIITCRQIEIRQNPESEKAEFRFVGDEMWLPTPDDGLLTNSCENQDGAHRGAI